MPNNGMFSLIRKCRRQRALFEAIDRRDLHQIQQLVAEGLDLNFVRQSYSPLFWAVCRMDSPQDRGIVNYLLSQGASPRAAGNEYLLGRAARTGDHETIDLALDAGHDIHCRPKHSSTALQGAAHKNKPDTMRYLIQRGATKEDFDVGRCRWYAIRNEVIRILLELGVNVPPDVRDFLLWEPPVT
jgi:hypothetical protein